MKVILWLIWIVVAFATGFLCLEVVLNYYSPGTWIWFFGTLGETAITILILKISLLVAILWD